MITLFRGPIPDYCKNHTKFYNPDYAELTADKVAKGFEDSVDDCQDCPDASKVAKWKTNKTKTQFYQLAKQLVQKNLDSTQFHQLRQVLIHPQKDSAQLLQLKNYQQN